MQRLAKRSNPSASPSSKVEADLGHAVQLDDLKRNRQTTRSARIFGKTYLVTVSESTRRMIWLGTLVILFFMERRRTRIRNSLNLEGTTVITGILIETTEDGNQASRMLNKFSNVTVGQIPFQETEACHNLITTNKECILYYPFADLREFRNSHPHERLKQVLTLPDNDSSAVLTQRGIGVNHEDGNQDRAIIISPSYPFSDPGISSDFLMALFDGHGLYGHHISQAAMTELPATLATELRKAKKARNGAVHELMTEVLIHTFRNVDKDVPDVDLSGTTAAVTLKLGEYLHIASVGDSRTFVVLYNKEKDTTKFFYSTTPDTPEVPTERDRILGMGGSIYLPPPGPRGIRLPPRVYVTLVYQETNESESFALENSRSIGDRAVKDRGVVCEPKVASLHLPSLWNNHPGEEVFVFSATDGLLDKMAVQIVADRIAGALYRQDTVSPLETIEGIILDANQIWEHSRTVSDKNELVNYRDDITLTVVKVQDEKDR